MTDRPHGRIRFRIGTRPVWEPFMEPRPAGLTHLDEDLALAGLAPSPEQKARFISALGGQGVGADEPNFCYRTAFRRWAGLPDPELAEDDGMTVEGRPPAPHPQRLQ